VANRLFYAEGVRATGTEKIMSIAEVAKATFYRHFESKDALVLAYLEKRESSSLHYLSQPTHPKDLREALTKFEQMANWPEIIGCPFLRYRIRNTRIPPIRSIAWRSNTKTKLLTI